MIPIYLTLLVSTKHLNERDEWIFQGLPKWVHRTPKGWRLVWIMTAVSASSPEEVIELYSIAGLSENLLGLIRLAIDNSCEFLEFDVDAEVMDGYVICEQDQKVQGSSIQNPEGICQ